MNKMTEIGQKYSVPAKRKLTLVGDDYMEPVLVPAMYYDGMPALQVEDAATGDLICTASVNVGSTPAGVDLFIKDWSENEGVLAWLIAQDIVFVVPEHDRASGFVTARAVKVDHERLLDGWTALTHESIEIP